MGRSFYNVTKQVTLHMTIQDHTETITLDVVAVGRHQIILGPPWCQYHHVEFNWDNLQIARWGAKCGKTCHLAMDVGPLLVKPLMESSTCTTLESIRYDLYATEPREIPSHLCGLVPTGYVIKTLEGTYGRIAPRSSLALKHSINMVASVIDPDY
jgi:dUTPase